MTDQVKAIQTEYDGHLFRSRLEARWAVFFNSLGVDYEYEPEGFELPSGKRYLPDFKVKCHGTRGACSDDSAFDLWIEVKGDMTQDDLDRIEEFSGVNEMVDEDGYLISDNCYAANPVLVVGNIPKHGVSRPEEDIVYYQYGFIDCDESFGAWPAADDHGRFYLWGADSNYINIADEPRVLKAYDAARKARFEYGETPAGRHA